MACRSRGPGVRLEKGGNYYFFFGANNIQSDEEHGGIGVAVAEQPGGPFRDYLGKPLVDRIHNGAQPIDQFVFRDADGGYYLVWQDYCREHGIVPFPGSFEGPALKLTQRERGDDAMVL